MMGPESFVKGYCSLKYNMEKRWLVVSTISSKKLCISYTGARSPWKSVEVSAHSLSQVRKRERYNGSNIMREAAAPLFSINGFQLH